MRHIFIINPAAGKKDGRQRVYAMAEKLKREHDLDVECMLTKSRGHATMLTRAIAETGEIVNIDGKGNRLAALAFGKKRVFIVAGVNKLCDDFDSAVYRARNVAATQNATRFDVKTPCKIDGKCHDCRSPVKLHVHVKTFGRPFFRKQQYGSTNLLGQIKPRDLC